MRSSLCFLAQLRRRSLQFLIPQTVPLINDSGAGLVRVSVQEWLHGGGGAEFAATTSFQFFGASETG